MKKIAIIGHFAFDKEYVDGQTIKTKTFVKGIEKRIGEKQVMKIDTHGGIKSIIKIVRQLIIAFFKCDSIAVLTAQNGLKVFIPLIAIGNMIFNRDIFYVVIGGWLPSVIKGKVFLKIFLKQFDSIFVETNIMKKLMYDENVFNVEVLPNCKELKIADYTTLKQYNSIPLRVCTFSRVMEEKGITDVINVIMQINEDYGAVLFELDIYGPIDKNYLDSFTALCDTIPDYIRYKGTISPDKSTEVLKEYYSLIFPTKYFTEGVPGTIIDAYAAGVPVVFSKWESYKDVVEDGVVGLGYEFGNINELKKILVGLSYMPKTMNDMKKNCLQKAVEFSSDKVMGDWIDRWL